MPELHALEQVLDDPAKAAVALMQFASDNSDGRCRKKLIDWVAFSRVHGVWFSFTRWEKLKLVDVSEYLEDQTGHGKSREEAMAAWESLVRDETIKREGSDVKLKLWLSEATTRFGDTTRYVDPGVAEGSRPLRMPQQVTGSIFLSLLTARPPAATTVVLGFVIQSRVGRQQQPHGSVSRKGSHRQQLSHSSPSTPSHMVPPPRGMKKADVVMAAPSSGTKSEADS